MEPKKIIGIVLGSLFFMMLVTIIVLGLLLSKKGSSSVTLSPAPVLSGGKLDSANISVSATAAKWLDPAVDPATSIPVDQGYVMFVTYDFLDASGVLTTGKAAPPLHVPVADVSKSYQILNYPLSNLNLAAGATLRATYLTVSFYSTSTTLSARSAVFQNTLQATRRTEHFLNGLEPASSGLGQFVSL